MLFVSGTQFDRFAADTSCTYEDLATWEGFFDTAAKYYDWSGGKAFCALDYLIRAVELNAMEQGGENFYTSEGWYDFDNAALKSSYMALAESYAQGHILVSDLYANTQMMTGEVAAGLGSTASILYYNDTVTYPDNTSEPMDLRILPMPKAAGKDLMITQAGVGLCAYKTTDQKAEAAKVFARWLTEPARNLEFCVGSGYMPVTEEAFAQIDGYDFASEPYRRLYTTLQEVTEPPPKWCGSLPLPGTTAKCMLCMTVCGRCKRPFPSGCLREKARKPWRQKPGRCCWAFNKDLRYAAGTPLYEKEAGPQSEAVCVHVSACGSAFATVFYRHAAD